MTTTKSASCAYCTSTQNLVCKDCYDEAVSPILANLISALENEENQRKISRFNSSFKAISKNILLENFISDFRSDLKRFTEAVKKEKQNLDGLEEVVKENQRRVNLKKKKIKELKNIIKKKETGIYTQTGLKSEKNIIQNLSESISIQMQDKNSSVAKSRRAKVMELAEIFPIIPPVQFGDTGEGSIAGFPFPTSFIKLQNMKLSQRSSAIMVLCRVICLSAKILEVNLPYKLLLKPKTVMIGVWNTNDSKMLDLSSLKPDFLTAIGYLSLCVETLCRQQGVPPQDVLPNEILNNLWQLFHSPSLGKSLYQSRMDAFQRIGLIDQVKTRKRAKSGSVDIENLAPRFFDINLDEENLSDHSESEYSSSSNEWNIVSNPISRK